MRSLGDIMKKLFMPILFVFSISNSFGEGFKAPSNFLQLQVPGANEELSKKILSMQKGMTSEESPQDCREKNKYSRKADYYDLSEVSVMGSNNKMFEGSSAFMKCDNLSMGMMKDLYRNGGVRLENFEWEKNIKYLCCSAKVEEREKCQKEAANHAAKCESVAFLINSFGRDWTDENINKPTKAESTARMPTQGANGASAMQALANAGAFKCVSAGMETLDFDGCKKFVTQLETIETFQQVGNQTQEVVYKGKIADSQLNYMNEKNTATGALKAQRDSFSMQKDMYNQRTAVDTAKLGYLYTIYKEIPDSNEIVSRCSKVPQNIPFGSGKVLSKDDCLMAVRGGFELTKNQAQLDAMKRKLIAIATEAGSNLILANLMGKSADNVDNAIKKVDGFKPIDPFVVSEEEAQTSFCKMNPGQPQCLGADLTRNFDTIDGNVITFGGGATGTNYGGTNQIQDTGTTTANAIGGSDKAGVTPVGSVISAAAQDNRIEGSTMASVTKGGGSSGGGGGGGGGSMGGGGGGGGGGSSGGAGAGAGGEAGGNVAPGGPKYSDANGFSVVGGFGINKQKKEGGSDENPFGKLFGKDSPKAAGVVNFRDIASQKVGDKSENIFDMISKRYTNVAADKRLIEYELTK